MARIRNRPSSDTEPTAPSIDGAHRRAAQATAAGGAAQAAAFELARDAMLVLDDARRTVAANRAARGLLASGWRTRRGLRGLIPPALAAVIAERWESLLTEGTAHAAVELIRDDGSSADVEAWLVARIAPGAHLLTVTQASDPRSSAALLAKLRRQLLEAQAVGGFGHWEWDVEAGTVEFSDELCRICGVEPGAAVTTFAESADLIDPDDRARVMAVLADAHERLERFSVSFRVVRPGGGVRTLESRGHVVRRADGAAIRMYGTAQDISERREAEAQRRNFSTILDGSDDAISACSTDGIFISWNRGSQKLYGYSAEEAIGKHVSMLLPPDESVSIDAAWQRTLAGEHVESFESLRVAKDGRRLIVAVTLSPIKNARGEIIGVAAVGRDMTEQKRVQAELAAAHAEAVEASRLKSEFMANVNHELRTPLNGVIGVSELLMSTALEDEQREYVEALRVSGEALMAVIEDILDFSKIEAGKLELTAAPFDVGALIEDVCSMVSVAQPARAIEVIPRVPVALPAMVVGDAHRVRQVLTNLTNNAVKFTEAGQVVVSVTASAANEDAITLRFEVADTGIGIDPAVQASIFESFSQADGSTTRRYGGTGLGLTIAKQLVTLMGGEIGVRSVPGKGSTFHFTLPTLDARASAPTVDPTLRDLDAVLLDGNRANHAHLEERLRDWGMRTHEADGGESALSLLRAATHAEGARPLLLLDYRLADGTPEALVGAVRAEPALSATAIVLMVAARDAHAAGTLAGVDGMIAKPVRVRHLHDELGRVIGERRAQHGPPAQSGRSGPAGRALRILVAEDNRVNQLVAVRMFERRGFVVEVAENGREAVEMHLNAPYDAIFMDCQMPELDGYAATREIRRRERGRRTPIIAMTASTMPSDSERASAAGMDHHTGKPLRAAALDHVIRLALTDAAPAARRRRPT